MAAKRLMLPVLIAALLLSAVCCKSPGNSSRSAIIFPSYPTHPSYSSTTRLDSEDLLAAKRGPRADAVRTEPDLRIRIMTATTSAEINAGSAVTVGPGRADLGKARGHTFQTPLRIGHDRQGFVLVEPSGKSVRWRLSTLSITSPTGRVSLGKTAYPGELELVTELAKTGQPTGRFDAINHVGMESYLPGVISKELYPGWDPETYRAQAIAARSYAIWEMNLPIRRTSHFDLEASQASQAYLGANASAKALSAVAATAGQVLVYNYRVLPAFYSSCSGGTGQDAIAAWPNKVDDLAPLRGKSHGGWGQKSTKFRWGPVTRDRAALSRRIAAWGKANNHLVAGLGTLVSVKASQTNRVGRPTVMTLTDTAGQTFQIACEDLRLAGNFAVNGLPKVDASNMFFSSHADFRIAGNSVSIIGRGFGHGVGMCQFGAEHMAGDGYNHLSILGFYYPGAQVKRVY